jgi:hypothetical protein
MKVMKKEADRIRSWRERQKADGKTSITVVLSQDARVILAEEKGKTGESYSVIVEKALQTLKKQGYRLHSLKHFSKREEVLASVSTSDNKPSVIPVTSHESGGQPKKMLIDDLVNYPSLKDIELEQEEKRQNGLYDSKLKEGFINRLFRSSTGAFSRKKKFFK